MDEGRNHLFGADAPLDRLRATLAKIPCDSLKVEQARGRTDEHGQFVLSVDDCRLDPAFAEAWYHLVDLLDDLGRSETVIECLRKSLQVAPEYVDAIFNLGSAAATKKSKCQGSRLLAPLSRYRPPIGMGYPRTPITKIL
jgi:tetratricopeptide (TPR) repeat protein